MLTANFYKELPDGTSISYSEILSPFRVFIDLTDRTERFILIPKEEQRGDAIFVADEQEIRQCQDVDELRSLRILRQSNKLREISIEQIPQAIKEIMCNGLIKQIKYQNNPNQ